MECRGKYIDLMEAQISLNLPGLVQLIKQCLHNAPHQRPSTDELLTILQRMREEVEGIHGWRSIDLEVMVRVRMAEQMKMKDTTTKELAQQQVYASSMTIIPMLTHNCHYT